MSAAPQTEPTEIVIHSPANGKELGRVPVMGAEQVRAAVARARAAQLKWAAVPIRERIRKLKRYRDELVARSQELIDLLVKENGKTPEEALFTEILPVMNISAWYFAKAPKILRKKHLGGWGLGILRRSYLHYVPRGVIAVISPWNFPFNLPMGPAFPALVAGNAVVIKPSEWTPLIMVKAKEIFDAAAEMAGFDKELLQVVTGYGPTGQALLESGIDKVEFTGSVAVGKKIGGFCGERLIPCTLELGGKAPAIVCEDADLDRATNAIVWGGFANSGQICISVERVLVNRKIAPELTKRLVEQVEKLRHGDPTMHPVDVGAMTFPKQVDNVERLVEDARAKGAKILTGGKRLPGPGRYYAPTLLSGVTTDMAIARQEIFGPAVPIIEVADDEEAIRVANDSHLGLNAYVFTKDLAKGRRIAERVHSGTTAINDVLGNFAVAELPFGGVKESGMGRIHGEHGLLAMVEARGVNEPRVPALKRDLWMYPYDRGFATFLHRRLPLVAKLLDASGWMA